MNLRSKVDKKTKYSEVNRAIEAMSNPAIDSSSPLAVMIAVSSALNDLYQTAFEAGYRVRDGEQIMQGTKAE